MPDIFGASGQFSIDALGNQYQGALNNAYGPQGFGGQTADYSAAGAAYGRATGGFNPVAPQAQPSVFDTGTSGIKYLPGGGIDQNDPGNIAAYYRMMGGGGYNPYSSQSYASQPSNTYSPQSSLRYLPGGGLDQNDPGNIAAYYRLMGGGGGMAQYAGMSMAPPSMMPMAPNPSTRIMPNIDPGGEARMGQENLGFTWDNNVINPDTRPYLQFQPQLDDNAASLQRDAIARTLMQSAQQARS
jgi:hypothetical protein